MSDPMTNMGADDVLASIRRLVSGTQDSQVNNPSATTAPERFVLSPDLRVVDGREDMTAPQPDLAPLVLDRTTATLFPREVETPPQVETPDAPAQPVFETERDSAEDTQATGAEQPESPTVEAAVHAAQVLLQNGDQDIEWTPAFDDTPDANAANHAAGLSLEERIAELENAVDLQSQNWDADGSDDFDDEPPKVFPQAFVQSNARVLNFRSASAEPHAETELDLSTATLEDEFPFSDDIVTDDALNDDVYAADSGAAHSGDDAQFSVDVAAEPETKPASQPVDVSQASRDADQSAAPMEAASDDEDDDLALAGYSADELFDEGALRDMIGEVIREELQGVLGERITSNVRRLVRREVQRALTLREFE